jgi:PPOX class probable F420-dependent enzyme
MSAACLDDLPSWATALLHEAHVARLGLVDDRGAPRVLPITFAIAAGAVWSAIDDKPKRRPGAELARVRWIHARPAFGLTVDRYDDDWSRLAWVQLTGTATVVDVSEHEPILDALAARYPAYRERRPRGPLLHLVPERAVCWRA